MNTTRYKVQYDEDKQFEEYNGESRPLTASEYQENPYIRNDGLVSYLEYIAYYGNPARHVYLGITREDQCPHCHTWYTGDSLWGIDVMDDSQEAQCIGTFVFANLLGYLKDVAADLTNDRLVRRMKE